MRAVAVRQAAGAAVENGDVLARLAAALEKGQQKKVLALCRAVSYTHLDVYKRQVTDSADSLLALIGQWLAVLFRPLGFGDWRCATPVFCAVNDGEWPGTGVVASAGRVHC